ncbi:MAG: hypothetical protein COA69_13040 [Robiginitomaculum sp.]|nr:MAG: hypothetical protein COA69_13040 [Robiginitomaculum sp.]
MATNLDINPALQFVKDTCSVHGNAPEKLLEILHDIQNAKGYIPNIAYVAIANALNLSRAEVYGVVSFYHDFRQTPPAQKTIKLCMAEACQSVGARELRAELEAEFGVEIDIKIPDSEIEIGTVFCLGNCALGPAVLVGGQVYGRVDAQRVKDILKGDNA